MLLLLALQMLILPTDLPMGIVNKPYDSPQLRLTGGTRCMRTETVMMVLGGRLPLGLHLSTAGVFEGTPQEEGVYPLRISASNGCGFQVAEMRLEVQGAPILDASMRLLLWKFKKGDLVAPVGELLVAGNWPGLAYRIDGAPDWLEVAVRQGRLPPKGAAFEADLVTLRAKPEALAPGRYKATLIISAWGGSRSPHVEVELEVTQ